MLKNINSILNDKVYGSSKNNETYNIEFVSANPTGPMVVSLERGYIRRCLSKSIKI